MRRVAFLLIIIFLLFACAFNGVNYGQQLENWVGQSEQSLLTSWGKPTIQKTLGNHKKLFIYIKYNDWYVPEEYFYANPMWGANDMIYDPFFDEYTMTPYSQIVDTRVEGVCQTSFTLIDGIITSYQWHGNGCQ